MSPQCRGCGGHVSLELLRVCAPEDVVDPPVCPNCPEIGQTGYAETLREILELESQQGRAVE